MRGVQIKEQLKMETPREMWQKKRGKRWMKIVWKQIKCQLKIAKKTGYDVDWNNLILNEMGWPNKMKRTGWSTLGIRMLKLQIKKY